jgi:hypothetical protein
MLAHDDWFRPTSRPTKNGDDLKYFNHSYRGTQREQDERWREEDIDPP